MARLTRNPNGTNYCEDCHKIVILFDDDTHECCECSEEYGPCEDHCEVIAQRGGASSRTADELVYVFLGDVFAIAESEEFPTDVTKLADAIAYWDDEALWDDTMGCRWVRDDVDAEIHDEIAVGESVLADMGLTVYWEDGYVISRVTGGPLVDEN